MNRPNNDSKDFLERKIRRTTLLIRIFGIPTIACVVIGLIFMSVRIEKVPVAFEDAEIGDYTVFDVISLENKRTRDESVYFYYTTQDDISGYVKFSEKEAKSEELLPLFEEGNNTPVRLYGTVRKEKHRVVQYGDAFYQEFTVIHGNIEPEKEMKQIEWFFILLGSVCLLVVRISSQERKDAKQRLRFKDSFLSMKHHSDG